jgi:hypothetical protein
MTASRLLYGMANERVLPRALGWGADGAGPAGRLGGIGVVV